MPTLITQNDPPDFPIREYAKSNAGTPRSAGPINKIAKQPGMDASAAKHDEFGPMSHDPLDYMPGQKHHRIPDKRGYKRKPLKRN